MSESGAYVRAYESTRGGYRTTMSLWFEKIGDRWRVDRYDAGPKMWHVTVGLRWDTVEEAVAYLNKKGWREL